MGEDDAQLVVQAMEQEAEFGGVDHCAPREYLGHGRTELGS
jgi:hypothetical protein